MIAIATDSRKLRHGVKRLLNSVVHVVPNKQSMTSDLKYVLLPRIDDRRRPPKFQPWYRERLKMKYPCHMDTKNWKFVKDGLDDFRDGLPPSHDDIMLQSEKGPSPVIRSETRRVKAQVDDVRNRLEAHQIYLSRSLPTVEKRRQLVDTYISSILDHPLAFFNHFNEAVDQEMYEKLSKLLEAELSRECGDDRISSSDDDQDAVPVSSSVPASHESQATTARSSRANGSNQASRRSQSVEGESKIASTKHGRSTIVYDELGNAWDSQELERKQKNPYRWFIEQQQKQQNAKGPTQDEAATSAMEARLRTVSEHFCNWLYELGGGSNLDVDPAVVRNLFSTAYDTKPSLSVPIKIVEMTRIPPELREGAKESMIAEPQESTKLPDLSLSSRLTKSKEFSTTPRSQASQARNYRYGAWYLPKSLWRHSLKTEELQDPEAIKAALEDPMRKQEEQMNARLAPLHGIDAFKEYLMEKNVRRLPKLIVDVEQYRRDNPRDLTDTTTDEQTKKN